MVTPRAIFAATALLLCFQPGFAQAQDDEGAGDSSEVVPVERYDSEDLAARFALQLQQLGDQIDVLKEAIFRCKSRLVLLRERVLGSPIAASRATITHFDDLGGLFDLHQLIFSLDGEVIYSTMDLDGSLSNAEVVEVFDGPLATGPHNLAVEMRLIGNGNVLFPYLEGYHFRVRSSYAFMAETGTNIGLSVIGYQQGDTSLPYEERPSIRYEFEIVDPYF